MRINISPAPFNTRSITDFATKSQSSSEKENITASKKFYSDMSYVELFDKAKTRLENLGADKENLYFLQGSNGRSRPFSDSTAQELQGLLEAFDRANSCQHVISFGGRGGGFEVAMQIQYDLRSRSIESRNSLEDSPAGNHTTYLDATSLEGSYGTEYNALAEDIDVVKMSNPYWDVAYQNAIQSSTAMTFLITPEWADSEFCRQELKWSESNPDLNRIFVMLDGVEDADKGKEAINDIKNSTSKQSSGEVQFIIMKKTYGAEIGSVVVE